MTCTCSEERTECDQSCGTVPKAFDFNPDPAWELACRRYVPVVTSIAMKYCAADESLRDDCAQEALIAIHTIRPEVVQGYDKYRSGELGATQWQRRLDSYVGNVIRNSVLSYLDSYKTGNWYVGRTRYTRDKVSGESQRVHVTPRFSSLDELVEDFGAQIDEEGQFSWPTHSQSGLEKERRD